MNLVTPPQPNNMDDESDVAVDGEFELNPVVVDEDSELWGIKSECVIPAMLLASRESREVASDVYKSITAAKAPFPQTRFNYGTFSTLIGAHLIHLGKLSQTKYFSSWRL
jgi:hypothetical protein